MWFDGSVTDFPTNFFKRTRKVATSCGGPELPRLACFPDFPSGGPENRSDHLAIVPRKRHISTAV